jgi:hypothetical protein
MYASVIVRSESRSRCSNSSSGGAPVSVIQQNPFQTTPLPHGNGFSSIVRVPCQNATGSTNEKCTDKVKKQVMFISGFIFLLYCKLYICMYSGGHKCVLLVIVSVLK